MRKEIEVKAKKDGFTDEVQKEIENGQADFIMIDDKGRMRSPDGTTRAGRIVDMILQYLFEERKANIQ